jgi:cytochrome c biogenesis protein CcdA
VLVLAVELWRSRHNETMTRLPQPGGRRFSAFALGAGIMAVELPTAFMYFGAISAILASHSTAGAEVAMLVVYNAIFVAPLVAIILVRGLAGEHAERWLTSAWGRLLGFGQILLASLTGGAGALLLVLGVTGLLAA